MSYVNAPNDLSKIKTKMVFNLTKRQLVCLGSAAAVGIHHPILSSGPWRHRQHRGHADDHARGVPAGYG